ncbi:MAG TPA: NAD kinase [Flavobacteriaceae bacterium]|nr:NAD kinase [Flavobacteriaceae bacterium]
MKVGIYGQFYHKNSEIFIQQLFDLIEKADIDFYIEKGFSTIIKENEIIDKRYYNFPTFEKLDNSFDLLFSIGGDGTTLKGVNLVKDLNIPIVGINTGRLGFLATIQKEEVEDSLAAILKGEYVISKRELLSLEINPAEEGEEIEKYFALNDIVINRKNTTSMITIETWLDGQYLNSYWADGLIVTTATGSTGYSLSCGGPIISPGTDAIALTPIAPHNLNARPLIIPSDTEIIMSVKTRADEFLVSMDSEMMSLEKGTQLQIKKAPFTISLVAIDEGSFIRTLRQKLLWGEDKRNKKQ